MNYPRTKQIVAILFVLSVFVILLASVILLSLPSASLSTQNADPSLEDPRVTVARKQCKVDLNGDGKCNSEDTALIRAAIGTCRGHAKYNEKVDVDHDGCITWSDQEKLFPMFTRKDDAKPCDLDGDGDCDHDDWVVFQESEHMCFDDPPVLLPQYGFKRAYNPRADANRDGCVLGDDQLILFPNIPER